MSNKFTPGHKKEIWYLKNLKTGEISVDRYYILLDIVASILSHPDYCTDDIDFHKATQDEVIKYN